ncbi:sensor histidine kinase [Actinomycetospora callitridis]|uniref:sensor histidine kinase n=1 Tax=Actinomycetospora callitridis TaxID=913944 RepID=UPI00236619C3|nr:ATP-binding protein [Actinomycetospora callitridis]MDD7921233.1 ATP-binding protein [Actinomycetospora callitridis]
MSGERPTRRALLRHAAVTAVVVLVAVVSITSGVAVFARQDVYREAEDAARQVVGAVGGAVSRHDLSFPVDPATRRELDVALGPFLASGITSRVKIWSAHGPTARIVYSDEPRVEGETMPVERLQDGGPLIQPVPDDPEHRFEIAGSRSLLEVFTSFEDATGADASLELYVAVDEEAAAWDAARPVVAVTVAGLLVLALATLPASLVYARRAARRDAEQRAARDYAFAAAETARQEIAQRLHEGVIPDLAGVGLLLEIAQAEDDGARSRSSVLGHAHELLSDEMQQLRVLLDDLVRPTVELNGLTEALRELATRMSTPGSAAITVEGPADASPSEADAIVLYRVAHELMRNAVRHAGASRIEVTVAVARGDELTLGVVDDGDGFDVDAPPGPGHVGLLLVRGVLADRGGRLELTSEPGRGTAAVVRMPRADAPRRHRRRLTGTIGY